MPQLVAAFHSLVGLAAVLVAVAAFLNPEAFGILGMDGNILRVSRIEMLLGAAIAVGGAGFLLGRSTLERPPVVQAPPVAEPSPEPAPEPSDGALGRADLIALASAAADSAASGRDVGVEVVQAEVTGAVAGHDGGEGLRAPDLGVGEPEPDAAVEDDHVLVRGVAVPPGDVEAPDVPVVGVVERQAALEDRPLTISTLPGRIGEVLNLGAPRLSDAAFHRIDRRMPDSAAARRTARGTAGKV